MPDCERALDLASNCLIRKKDPFSSATQRTMSVDAPSPTRYMVSYDSRFLSECVPFLSICGVRPTC